MMEACSSSMQRGDVRSAVRTLAGEATRRTGEVDALPTSNALAFAVHIFTGSEAPASRAFSQPGPLVERPAATRRCDTDFPSVGLIEDELEASAGASALSGLGRGDAACSDSVETLVAFVRAPMQKQRRLGRKSVSRVFARSATRNHLTMRWSEQRAAVRFKLVIATSFSLRATRHPARCRSSCSR